MKAARAARRRRRPHEGGKGRTKAARAARRRRRQHDDAIGIFNPSAHQGEGRTGFRWRLGHSMVAGPLDGGGAAAGPLDGGGAVKGKVETAPHLCRRTVAAALQEKEEG
jgi:hypothetical protein